VRRDLEMMHLMDVEFADIQANPTMVAHAGVPWQAVAAAAPPQPATAGFSLAPATVNNNSQFAALSAVPSTPLPAGTDEDAAEAHRAPDENYAVIQSQAPQLASVAAPPRPVPSAGVPAPAVPSPRGSVAAAPIPKIRPMARPDVPGMVALATPPLRTKPAAPTKPQQVAMATQPPKAKPAVPPKPQQVALATPAAQPALRPEVGEGDVDQPGLPGRNWTIQIGAFADQALARAQLDSYASKAKDIVGQAAHIVAPIQAANGHMLYRARFGPYAEREARNVCGALTQRGEACFAVVTR
jgi:D-alanyl-D-alanine carboxypeptidase